MSELTTEQQRVLLTDAIRQLGQAAEQAFDWPTTPQTPRPRLRQFHIVPGLVIWPYPDQKWSRISVARDTRSIMDSPRDSAEQILKLLGYQPRKVLRALRRIQAATAWCQARAQGRRRAAREILHQQRAAAAILEAEVAIRALQK